MTTSHPVADKSQKVKQGQILDPRKTLLRGLQTRELQIQTTHRLGIIQVLDGRQGLLPLQDYVFVQGPVVVNCIEPCASLGAEGHQVIHGQFQIVGHRGGGSVGLQGNGELFHRLEDVLVATA